MGLSEVGEIKLRVNGEDVTVRSDSVPATLSLGRFIREHLNLTGTKISCAQGGCGACTVVAAVKDDAGGGDTLVRSVNSCLIPLMTCDGWSVTTVEGVGTTRGGMGEVQDRISRFHGTQCGFCTPGMVMTMHGLREKTGPGKEPALAEVEGVLDGNMCRCTGYRPILDAFKSFSPDAPDELKKKWVDIEDLGSKKGGDKICPRTREPCSGSCGGSAGVSLKPAASGETWHVPKTLQELLAVLKAIPDGTKYRIVGGNTGTGVYDDGPFSVFVNVNHVKELRQLSKSPTLTFGGGVTLNEAIDAMNALASEDSSGRYSHLGLVAKHWRKVANTAVRNAGTVAGNLMLKHAHHEFPSDLFLTLESLGAHVVVAGADGKEASYTPEQWLRQDMKKKVVRQVVIPPADSDTVYRSFKICPRNQNAHAYVNAAFRAKVSKDGSFVGRPTVVYGGISSSFVHATKTEDFLKDKRSSDKATFQAACKILDGEVVPEESPLHASVEYRKHLTKALLYKFALATAGESKSSASVRSGADNVPRGVSRGDQSYKTDPSIYPLGKPIPKVESRAQCTGEAEYFNDVPPIPGEIYGALVLTTRASCELDKVDPAAALAMPGVVAYMDHKDIPGKNQGSAMMGGKPEEIFCTGTVHTSGQQVGVVLAETPELAIRAAAAVSVTYKNEKKPVLTIRDALKDPARVSKEMGVTGPPYSVGDIDAFDEKLEKNFPQGVRVVEGELDIGTQHHFHLETHTTLVRPQEDGQYEVLCSTQWMMMTQGTIAAAIGVPMNAIDMKVRRLGGGYGGKINNVNLSACACAVAAHKLQRPVRIALDLKTNMESVGKRLPYLIKYKAAVDKDDKLKSVGIQLYCDTGYLLTAPTTFTATMFSQNVYASDNWRIIPGAVTTNTPANTYCRAPGTTQGHAAIEHVVEHIATTLGVDPLEFRMKNLLKKGDKLIIGADFEDEVNPMIALVDQLKYQAKYDERKKAVEAFNKANKWKKHGISLVPVRYLHNYFGASYSILVSIYSTDGTVVVTTGGIEMGQGLNTKVAQTVARELGVTVDMVRVRPSNNITSANDFVTGGSCGSEGCAAAAVIACQELKARMKKVKAEMDNNDPTWMEVVTECQTKAVDLTARHLGNPNNDDHGTGYLIWGAVLHEVEVDILTGEINVRRTDIMEETGTSISPEVDIGQVEGGYVFSLGLWLTERAAYDPDTGRLLSNSTWDYKPPFSSDIPEDLRTTFVDLGNNPPKIMGSKATGEPTVLMGVGVMFAIRAALKDARTEAGIDPKHWFKLDGPATVEKIQTACGITSEHFTF